MDREIDVTFRRRRVMRRVVGLILSVALVAAVFIWGPRLIKPSVARARIRTAKVDTGVIEATITASGTVLPEFEGVISSPVNARVLKILKRPGAVLSKGDPILELDLNESRLAVEKLNRQIELKQNQQAKAKLDLENTLIDLQGRWEIKNLEYKASEAATARNRELRRQGLMSEERLREVELIEEKTAFELKQLEESKRNAQASTKTQLEGLALEMKTLDEEGATAQKGAVLARIADLSAFRVEATVSDVHANRLSFGQPVKVKVNDELTLSGAIARINPTVNNGVITLVVGLEDKSNAQLRSNLRVDVLIGAERKDGVLRVRKGPSVGGEGVRDIFVIRGDVALKTAAKFGVAGADYCEVVQGLLEGDEVIISDMTDYMHLNEVKLR